MYPGLFSNTTEGGNALACVENLFCIFCGHSILCNFMSSDKKFFFRIYFAFVETIFGFQSPIFPGDPARFHSFYIAVIVLGDTQLDNQEIAAMSRLGTSVKKTVLICSEDEHHKLTYISLQWAGIT